MQKIIYKISIWFIALLFLLMSFTPVAAASKSQYFLSFLYSADTRTFGYISAANTGRESKEDVYSNLDTNKSMFMLKINDWGSVIVEGNMITDTDYLTYHPYSFPEFNDVDGSSQDYSMSLSVGGSLTKSLNNAMAFVLKPVSTSGRKEMKMEQPTTVFALAVSLSNAGYDVISSNRTTFKSFEYGKLKWEMKRAVEEDMVSVKNVIKGYSVGDYVVIKNYNNETITLPYLIPKGYSEDQTMYAQHLTQNPLSSITEKMSWGHVVYLASAQLSNGYTVQNNSEIKKQDKISEAIGGFLNTLISAATGAFGLYDVEELMFNSGNRGTTYYYGIMPISWLNPVNVLNLFATVVATVIIGLSIVRMLIKRNMAAIMPSAKAELMDGVKDLFVVMAGILMFMPALYILLNFNSVLVSAMRDMSPIGATLGLTSGGDFVGIIAAIMAVAYFFVLLMINITYIIRAVTLALLIGFAPMFIAMFAAGPAAKKISATWLKELISNIFMQTFNAAILLIFANIGTFGSLTVIERFALLISFIPLTKFFKSALMNLGSGADAAADKTSGAFSSFATGLMAGTLAAGYDGKSEKKGKIVDSNGGSMNISGNDTTAPLGSGSNGSKESFIGKLGTIGKNMTAPGERGRLGKKALGMMGGAGVSLGSAATGGSPLLGNAAIVAGANSIANQMEGWSIKDEDKPQVLSGSDLKDSGVSGFDGDAMIFSNTASKNINESEDSRKEFLSELETYNNKEENLSAPAEVLYKDNGKDIYGVKLPGVSGKTIVRKNPETQRVIATESTVSGFSKVSSFKPVMEKYTKEKEKVKETVENPES